MKISEIINEQEKYKKSIIDKIHYEILKLNPSFNIIKLSEYQGAEYKIYHSKEICGYLQSSNNIIKYDDDIASLVDRIESHYNYIDELFVKYPKFCKINEELLKIYKYSKITKLDIYNNFVINIKLCDYLVLPNTTHTGFGGGDFEVKRTPQRVEQFLDFVDKAISSLQNSIKELEERKSTVLKLEKIK